MWGTNFFFHGHGLFPPYGDGGPAQPGFHQPSFVHPQSQSHEGFLQYGLDFLSTGFVFKTTRLQAAIYFFVLGPMGEDLFSPTLTIGRQIYQSVGILRH